MNAVKSAVLSLGLVMILVLVAYFGVTSAGLEWLFAIVIPYAAILVFLTGFTYRVVTWARAPVPFRIPTTAGQQKTLSWIRNDELEAPSGMWGVIRRMVLEVVCFRSLFRNSRAEMRGGPRLAFSADKWLWLGAIVFHYGFLVVFLRHLRFFTEPVPAFVRVIENIDGFVEVALPTVYVSTAALTAAIGFLLLRRLINSQVRYISLAADYFPLFLLLAIVTSGVVMRHFAKTDVLAVKELGTGLIALSPGIPAAAGAQFYVHIFMVSTLIAYFPFSKLMHMGGVFLSPTRNMANNNRRLRHVNPWNPDVRTHDFDDWAEEFKEEIAQAGYELKR